MVEIGVPIAGDAWVIWTFSDDGDDALPDAKRSVSRTVPVHTFGTLRTLATIAIMRRVMLYPITVQINRFRKIGLFLGQAGRGKGSNSRRTHAT